MTYVPTFKKLEEVFEILILKLLANFSILKFVLSIWNISSRAI